MIQSHVPHFSTHCAYRLCVAICASVVSSDPDVCNVKQVAHSVETRAATRRMPVQAPPAPGQALLSIAPDTPERIEKFFSMRPFGMGAELLPFLGVGEARAMRLVCQRFHVAVDRRAWPVRDTIARMTCSARHLSTCNICVCVCVCVCVCACVCVRARERERERERESLCDFLCVCAREYTFGFFL